MDSRSVNPIDRPLGYPFAMRLSLRWQLVATFLAINFLTLAVVAALDALLAARRTKQSIEKQLNELVATLSRSTFPINDQVLSQIEGLTGAKFVLRSASGKTLASSDEGFEAKASDVSEKPAKTVHLEGTASILGSEYFHAVVELQRPVAAFERQTLHVFYSTGAYNAARRDAITPPLLVSLAAIPLAASFVLALAQRIAAPIGRLRAQVARISSGDYSVASVDSGTQEVRELSQSVQQMAEMLDAFTQATRKTERLKALAQVNASLIHQLRNSLTGCKLAVELHQRKCASPKDESLEMAIRQLEQMADYVNRFVQVEGQKSARESVDLCELLRGVLNLARPKAKHLGASLEATLPEDPLKLIGDPQALRQVMTNLINNALEATIEFLASGARPQVVVRLQEREGNAIFEVGDAGPGVPEDIGRQLFEPFTTGKPEGLGLGLFVAKTATEAHAGRIETQRVDGLTWFVVTIPLPERE
jgi:signal transduction histidine kinase